MLVLTRERDQSLIIGEQIEVRVIDIRGHKVRLGVTAPRDVSVHRREIYDQIKAGGPDKKRGVPPAGGGGSADRDGAPTDGGAAPTGLAQTSEGDPPGPVVANAIPTEPSPPITTAPPGGPGGGPAALTGDGGGVAGDLQGSGAVPAVASELPASDSPGEASSAVGPVAAVSQNDLAGDGIASDDNQTAAARSDHGKPVLAGPQRPQRPLRVAVLASGGGTTLLNLIDSNRSGRAHLDIRTVIASRPGIGALRHAERAGIAHQVIGENDKRGVAGGTAGDAGGDAGAGQGGGRVEPIAGADFQTRLFTALDEAGVDLVLLGGWLKLLEVPQRYAGRMMNIHPALLPSFGGRGLYGRHVHEAVLAHGCKISGCTVHFVDNEYDAGPIVLQRSCAVEPGDTPESLAARVFELEKAAYPDAIEAYRTGRLNIQGRQVTIAQRPG